MSNKKTNNQKPIQCRPTGGYQPIVSTSRKPPNKGSNVRPNPNYTPPASVKVKSIDENLLNKILEDGYHITSNSTDKVITMFFLYQDNMYEIDCVDEDKYIRLEKREKDFLTNGLAKSVKFHEDKDAVYSKLSHDIINLIRDSKENKDCRSSTENLFIQTRIDLYQRIYSGFLDFDFTYEEMEALRFCNDFLIRCWNEWLINDASLGDIIIKVTNDILVDYQKSLKK